MTQVINSSNNYDEIINYLLDGALSGAIS